MESESYLRVARLPAAYGIGQTARVLVVGLAGLCTSVAGFSKDDPYTCRSDLRERVRRHEEIVIEEHLGKVERSHLRRVHYVMKQLAEPQGEKELYVVDKDLQLFSPLELFEGVLNSVDERGVKLGVITTADTVYGSTENPLVEMIRSRSDGLIELLCVSGPDPMKQMEKYRFMLSGASVYSERIDRREIYALRNEMIGEVTKSVGSLRICRDIYVKLAGKAEWAG